MAPTFEKIRSPKIRVNVATSTESVLSPPPEGDNDLDEAFKYLNNHADIASEGINVAKLRRKIDWNIMPIMFACNTFQFLDKALINYAAVMGIKEDLNLTKNNFSNAASAFYIAYLIAEVPTGYILQKIPPGKWLGLNVTLWGITCAAIAGTFNYHSLLAARVMLGMFEAAVIPCLMLLSSQYYTKSEQAPRFSIWFSGVGVGQILGGLISFSFQHVENTQFKSWQAMFVCVGVLTILFGIATFFIIPDSPMKAKFLITSEKAALLKHISINQTGVQNRHFKMSQVWELFFDPQIYLLNISAASIGVSAGVVVIYSSTLIQSFGFSSKHTALLNMPSGVISILSAVIVGYGVRKFGQRWAWLSLVSVPGIIGGSLLSFVPQTNRAASLTGIYFIGFISGIMVIIYQWTMSNVAGHTKRTIAAALIAGCFSIGNIIGPQTFQAKDAPGYKPAKLAVLGTQTGGGFVAIVLFGYYVWANRRKDKRQTTVNLPSALENEKMLWENMTDKENPSFRYIY